MRIVKHLIPGIALAILSIAIFCADAQAMAKKIIYSFHGDANDGTSPNGLTLDASGNLYGTTYYGGDTSCFDGNASGCGTVFELMPQPGGGWSEKILRYFNKYDQGGINPRSKLVFDASGHLYGTTAGGGRLDCGYGGTWCGTVFELAPNPDGSWTEKVLHYFQANRKDGITPRAGVIFDADGNLYGTTYAGGTGTCNDGNLRGCGTVFKLTHRPWGGWVEKILYSFRVDGDDGIYPHGALTLDADGHFFGTCTSGGSVGNGTVFELLPVTANSWKEKIVHSFGEMDGSSPWAPLTFDAKGNIFGTTPTGPGQDYGDPCDDGTDLGCGVIFELTPNPDGSWDEKVLHYFSTLRRGDGIHPASGVLLDSNGDLLSTTSGGGELGYGTAFEMIPNPDGTWIKRQLNFDAEDDVYPANLIFGPTGNFYGTSWSGGQYGFGAVFEIVR